MKKILLTLCFVASSTAFANGSSGGVPSVPCYLDGEYQGTVQINYCQAKGGSVNEEKSLEISMKNKESQKKRQELASLK